MIVKKFLQSKRPMSMYNQCLFGEPEWVLGRYSWFFIKTATTVLLIRLQKQGSHIVGGVTQ